MLLGFQLWEERGGLPRHPFTRNPLRGAYPLMAGLCEGYHRGVPTAGNYTPWIYNLIGAPNCMCIIDHTSWATGGVLTVLGTPYNTTSGRQRGGRPENTHSPPLVSQH